MVAKVESYAGLQLDLWITDKRISHSIEKRKTDSICVPSTVVMKMKETIDTNDHLFHIEIILWVLESCNVKVF